jgi:branched-chain amino acid transport system substrate-binding protein
MSVARAEILIGAAGPSTGRNAYIGDQALADLYARDGVLGQQVRLTMVDERLRTGQAGRCCSPTEPSTH